jgi:monoamine oxidase
MAGKGTDRLRVIVLGAGVAGLGAAARLVKGGAEVTVIEARDRIGGRTYTSHLWPDLPVDMGASWIHGTKGNPVTKLARKVGLRITPTTYDRAVTFDQNGRPVDFKGAAKRALKLVERARLAVDDLDADVTLEAAVMAFPGWQVLTPATRAVYRLAINTRIEHEYSGDWSRLSAWHFDDGDDFPGDESVVTPGYGPIVGYLARGIDIRLGEPVTSISPSGRGVTVTTRIGQHRADCVVVTLPLGVLQSGRVVFAEPLERKRQRAIDGLGMGLLNKCVLRFDRVFWPAGADWIDYLSPAQTLWADWTSYLHATGKPLLAGFNAARSAEEVETLDDVATTESAMEALRAMFGSAVPAPVGGQISRWRQDPFALGAYSFQAVGTSGKDRKALSGADWEGRLHFAGEATSRDHPSTVHGALMTGREAAQAILLGA